MTTLRIRLLDSSTPSIKNKNKSCSSRLSYIKDLRTKRLKARGKRRAIHKIIDCRIWLTRESIKLKSPSCISTTRKMNILISKTKEDSCSICCLRTTRHTSSTHLMDLRVYSSSSLTMITQTLSREWSCSMLLPSTKSENSLLLH